MAQMLGGAPLPVNRDEPRAPRLVLMFLLCSFIGMERIDTSAVAHAILDAPGWARVGITAPSSCLREDAALELVRVIADAVEMPAQRGVEEQAALRL